MPGRKMALLLVSVGAFLGWMGSSAQAIILDPGYIPPSNWSGKPADNVVGKYGGNASLVVIGSRYALTTTHQGTGNATVSIGGTTYYSTDLATGGGVGADIRILKLWTDVARTTPASLSDSVAIYNDTNENGKNISLGGYGRGTGTVLQASGNVTYGYQWNSTSALRWASNKIEGTKTAAPNQLVWGDFDIPGSGAATNYEGTIAEWDSGGGWFWKAGNTWAVLGLSRELGNYASGQPGNEAWIRLPNGNDLPNGPNQLGAMRVSSYAGWVQTQIANDGGSVVVVPEPTSLTLLVGGGLLLLRRQKARSVKER